MKASLIALLPVACFMQSALAAPAAAHVDNEARAIVGAPTTSSSLSERDVEKRDLIGGLLGGLGGSSGGSSSGSDVTNLPELGQLNVLVTQVVNIVKGIDGILTGVDGGNITSILPSLTDQLGVLGTTLQSVQSTVQGLLGNGLSVTQLAGISVLLNTVFNAVATLVAQLTTIISQQPPLNILTPVTTLLNQLLTSIGDILNLNLLGGL